MAEISAYSRQQLNALLSNYKLTPLTLAMRLNPAIIPARHLMYISSRIAAGIARGNARFVISLPPRHGKSELITKNTPIWSLEHYGNLNVILTSYGAELSTDFGRKIRDLIKDNEQNLNLRIRKDAKAVNNWLTDQGGAMMSMGVGGPITGRGANLLLVDDYIKEVKEALSVTTREYIWNWFVTTAFTRIEPGGTCIIIATRWHMDDLIGRILLENPGGRWENIRIPAIAEENDLIGRKVGEPLFPERGFNLTKLQEIRDMLGTYWFNALYQQTPEDENAKLTDAGWLKFADTLPDPRVARQARIWDFASTPEAGDYTVGTHAMYHPFTDTYTITDVKRGQFSPNKIEDLVVRTARELDGPNCKIYIEQEPGASGKQIVAHYQNILKGYDVEGVPASDGKIIRAQPFLAAAEAGRVFLYHGTWNAKFIDEFKRFPNADNDDQVDTAATGYAKLSMKKSLSASWGRDTDPDKQAASAAIYGIQPDPKTTRLSTGLVFGRR